MQQGPSSTNAMTNAEPKLSPRTQQAIEELKQLITARYPQATFSVVSLVADPPPIHLYATVDVEDTDEVLDLVIDRLLDLQIDEDIPLHVIPLRTPERNAELQARQSQERRQGAGFSLWLSNEDIARLRQLASESGVSPQEWLQHCVRQGLQQTPAANQSISAAQEQTNLHRQGDRLYDRYAKPLEAEHWGEYVVISPKGQVMLGTDLHEVSK